MLGDVPVFPETRATVDAGVAKGVTAEDATAKAVLLMQKSITLLIPLLNSIPLGTDFEPALGCVMGSILNRLSMAFGNGNPSE